MHDVQGRDFSFYKKWDCNLMITFTVNLNTRFCKRKSLLKSAFEL